MANPTIEIIIAAQADQFKRELDQVRLRVAKLERSLTGSTRGTQKFIKSTNQGQNALRDFSRVVQDAPFGIIGVGNNIQELAGSFGFLVRSSGGVRAAFASIAGALSGPGGLILLVSAVTTALTVFQMQSRKTKTDAKSLKDEIDELRDGFAEFKRGELLDIDIAELKGEGIQKGSEALIRTIESQKILNQSKINELNSIIASNNALRVQKTILGGLGELVKTGIGNVWATIKRDIKAVTAFVLVNAQGVAKGLGIYENIEATIEGIKNLDEKRVELTDEEKNVLKERNKLVNDQKELTKDILKLQQDIKKEQEDNRVLPRPKAAERIPNNELADIFGVTPEAEEALGKTEKKYVKFLNRISERARDAARNIKEEDGGPLATLREQFEEQLVQLDADIIAGGVSDLFGSVAEAIANGGNVLGAAAQSLLKTFGKYLTKYGTLLITYGKLTAAKGKLDIASAAGGPIAIAAGLAAIKVGIAATAAGAAISALASSGLFGAGGAGGVSSTGGGSTSVQSPSFAPTEQVVVFEIAGDKLIGVLNNTQTRNNRLSGSRISG